MTCKFMMCMPLHFGGGGCSRAFLQRYDAIAGSCTQWEIYDEYIKDMDRQKMEEALKSKGAKKGPAAGGEGGSKSQESVPPMQQPQMGKSARIMDRMVNQNMYEEISMDFKYWEDASDAFRWAPDQGRIWGRTSGTLPHSDQGWTSYHSSPFIFREVQP